MESSSAKLEPFLLMAKSVKGAAAAKLVQDATSAPGVYVFSELLELAPIAELKDSETHKPYHALLSLFAYGTYADYKRNKNTLPILNETQVIKLKHLTLVSFAMHSRILSFEHLREALDLPTVHTLESLVIDAIYAGLIRGKLDQNEQRFEVEYTVGRDVPNAALSALLRSLEDWSLTTITLLNTLDIKLNSLANQSAVVARETEEHDDILNANLREIAEKREWMKRIEGRIDGNAVKEGSAAWARKAGEDDMDVDEPPGLNSGLKGKNRKATQEISGKSRTKRNRT